jgi:hypothetical protein
MDETYEEDEILSQYSDYEDESKPVYENYEFYSSDGIFLGYASKSKIKFYSKRQECCTIDHLHKKIIFNKPFDASHVKSTVHYDKENQCVVCGSDYNLSATKIIPKYFTLHFSPEIKTGSENVICVCKSCLSRVNKYITSYKQKLYHEHNIDVKYYEDLNMLCNCYKLATTYLESFKENSVYVRRDKLIRRLTKFLMPIYFKREFNYRTILTKEEIEEFVRDVEENKLIDPTKDYLNDELVKRVGDMAKFKEDWLKEFFENIEMPFLPKIIYRSTS